MEVTFAESHVPASALRCYIVERDGGLPVPGTGFRAALGRLVPRWLRPALRRWLTNILSPYSRMAASRIAGRGEVQLHLGCGESPKTGWVNVDLVGLPVDLAWNLDNALPFPSGSVDAIFHEHVLEHLQLDRGLNLVEESFRVLKPGGVMRIGVPDAGRYVASYADPGRSFIHSMRPGRPTALLALQEEFYLHGHRTMYDLETIELVCRTAGFTRIDARRIGESHLNPCPDSQHREGDTLYIEAVR